MGGKAVGAGRQRVSCYLKALGQAYVPRRRSRHEQILSALDYHLRGADVVYPELEEGYAYLDADRPARLDADPLEAAELLYRAADCRIGQAEVYLHHLAAVPVGDVFHRHFGGEAVSAARELHAEIFKARVSQPVSEGVERLALKVHICAARRSYVVVKDVRQVELRAVPCYRQTSCGVVVSEEGVRRCRAQLRARVAAPYHRRRTLRLLTHSVGVTGHQHQHRAGIDRRQQLCHARLNVQSQSPAVVAFLSGLHGVVADAVDNGAALTRDGGCAVSAAAQRLHIPEQVVGDGGTVSDGEYAVIGAGQPPVPQKFLDEGAPAVVFQVEGLAGEPVVYRAVVELYLVVAESDVAAVLHREEIAPVLAPVLKLELCGFGDAVGVGADASVLVGAEVFSVWRLHRHDIPKGVVQHLAALFAHTLQHRTVVGGVAGVPVHKALVGEGAHYGYPACALVEGEYAVVFEEHHLLAGGAGVHLAVSRAVDDFLADAVELRPVELTQPESCVQSICHRAVDILPADESLLQRLFSRCLHEFVHVGHGIAAGFQREHIGFGMAFGVPVSEDVLGEIPAVADHEPEPPLGFEQAFKLGVHDSRQTVYLVVSRHDAPCPAEADSVLEGGVVVFILEPRRKVSITAAAFGLVVVGAEVLEGGDSLEESVGVLPRHAVSIGGSEFTREADVLAVGFLSTPPARVAHHVNGRSPEHQPAMRVEVIVSASFVPRYLAQPMHKLAVESGGETYRLREYGRRLVLAPAHVTACDLCADIELLQPEPFCFFMVSSEQSELFLFGEL